jgi:hypothetical protein
MESIVKVTGNFQDIRLDFTPEAPLEEKERSRVRANYPTTLAYLHIYLNGKDVTASLPSGYMLWILAGLLRGFTDLVSGQTTIAQANWYSDPWCFELRSNLKQNRVYITLHIPEQCIVMQDVGIPLDSFGHEIIRISQKWLKYLDRVYYEEIVDSKLGSEYRQFEKHLKNSQKALQEYINR